MSVRRVVPVVILTGFLGSGKTSLLAAWLRSPAMAGALAIINELGEVGIDDRLVESSSDLPLLLENGCACCAAGEDLSATLERLFWRQLHREIPPISRVLIETTGLADPEPILARLAAHALLSERFHVAAIVTAFDARQGPEQLATFPECRKQLAAATLVVVTKTDLASAGETAAAVTAVREHAPEALLTASGRGSLTADALLEMVAGGSGAAAKPVEPHDHEHAPGLPHAAHADGVTTEFLPIDRPLARARLEEAVARLATECGRDLLRVKGIVGVVDNVRLHSVQLSPGEGLSMAALPERSGPLPRLGITIISRYRDAGSIAALLAERLSA